MMKFMRSLGRAIWGFGSFILFLITLYISLYPENARNIAGDKFMNWYLNLPGIVIWAIFAFIFVCFLVFELYKGGVFGKRKSAKPQFHKPAMHFDVENNDGLIIGEHKGDIYWDSKKRKKSFDPEKPETVFYNRFYHSEVIIEGANPEQVINYVKDNISAGLWFFHDIDNKIAYDVDSTRTQFFDPEKDNTAIHGIIFHGIKYDLEQKEGGFLKRKEIEKLPDMFTMSVIPVGLGDKVNLQVKFNSHIQAICYFFDFAEKELGKMFVIRGTQEAQVINIYPVTPAIFIENNTGKNWEHCRLKIIKLDGKSVLGRLCWREVLAMGDIEYECNCLDGSKVFVSFENLTNQNNLRAIKGTMADDKDILLGKHTLDIEFKASDLSGTSITRYINTEIEFKDFSKTKYGIYNHPKVLKVESREKQKSL